MSSYYLYIHLLQDLNVFLICISFDPCLCLSHLFSSISHSPNSFSLSSHYQMHHVLWQNETLAFTQRALCYHRWNKRERWKSKKKKKNRHFLFKHHCHVKMTSPPLHSEHERGVGELQCHFWISAWISLNKVISGIHPGTHTQREWLHIKGAFFCDIDVMKIYSTQ